jgi:uncharacterized RDD family membrane protein YckC
MVLMDIWQTLEIEPTPDQKAIKRAYAKKLKITRPDENPGAFQDLHQAYKLALQEAEYWDEHEHTEIVSVENQDTDNQHNIEDIGNQNNASIIAPDNIALDIAPIDEQISENPASNNSQEEISNPTQEEIPVNPYQVEGERILGITSMLLSSQGEQAKAKSWEFIIESPFILEDQFNWRLGLELLRVIHEHNLNHVAKVSSLVGQEALTYLNSIFNWMDNRYHVTRALGDEYNTWLDMIKDNTESEKDYRDKIRGGKNLLLQQKNTAPTIQTSQRKSSLAFSRFCAFFLDSIFLIILIGLLANGENTNNNQAISTQAWGILSIIVIFIYFFGFEASILQGTPGKRIMKLAVVTEQGEAPGFLPATLRTLCFFAFYIFFFVLAPALLGLTKIFGPAAAIIPICIQLYGIYLATKAITLYDKISKTRVIQI